MEKNHYNFDTECAREALDKINISPALKNELNAVLSHRGECRSA